MNSPPRIGVITPSSNTALEPLTCALATAAGCTAHFARFRVTSISLAQQALGQFDDENILAAAEMLADAKVDVITWSGTAAGWRGFDHDERLVERIHQRTGIRATTAVLALNSLLKRKGIDAIAVVSPYTEDVQQQIMARYAEVGIRVVHERHLGISVNHDFALVTPETLDRLIREVGAATPRPGAVITYCTNLRAAQLAAATEAATGVPLLDTVSTNVWGALRILGVDPTIIKGWGTLFDW
jgi:maleate isomerase